MRGVKLTVAEITKIANSKRPSTKKRGAYLRWWKAQRALGRYPVATSQAQMILDAKRRVGK